MLLNSLMKYKIIAIGKTQCFHSSMKISRLKSLITEKRKHNTDIDSTIHICAHT